MPSKYQEHADLLKAELVRLLRNVLPDAPCDDFSIVVNDKTGIVQIAWDMGIPRTHGVLDFAAYLVAQALRNVAARTDAKVVDASVRLIPTAPTHGLTTPPSNP